VATFVVLTEMLEAMFGPAVLSWLGVTSPAARGVALGTISHAIGTSATLAESEEAAAMATLSMMAVPLLVSLAGPAYFAWLLQLWTRI
jgi:putative effector of murein hydrolase